MRLKLYVGLILALLFVCAVCSALAQTAPAATQGKFPLSIGGGFSDWDAGWQNGRMYGGGLWIDYTLKHVPALLRGIGLEAEAHDISIRGQIKQPPNQREDVATGGLIYSLPRYRNFRPYGKFEMGLGNDEYDVYPSGVLVRYHQTRTVTTVGGGVEYRVFRNIWARADYEYQFWPDFFKSTTPPGQLNPEGFTVGAMYHFGLHRSH